MSNDTTEVKLPSGKVAIIRNYTTQGDDREAGRLTDAGTTVSLDGEGRKTVSISAEAISQTYRFYVESLVRSIDGNGDNIPQQLDDLRSEDYQAIYEAVEKIIPKAKSKSSH